MSKISLRSRHAVSTEPDGREAMCVQRDVLCCDTGYNNCLTMVYVGVLISLWLFLFAAQSKEFVLDGLKKLEQRSHKCVEFRGEYVE
jgi:hypothetical protein